MARGAGHIPLDFCTWPAWPRSRRVSFQERRLPPSPSLSSSRSRRGPSCRTLQPEGVTRAWCRRPCPWSSLTCMVQWPGQTCGSDRPSSDPEEGRPLCAECDERGERGVQSSMRLTWMSMSWRLTRGGGGATSLLSLDAPSTPQHPPDGVRGGDERHNPHPTSERLHVAALAGASVEAVDDALVAEHLCYPLDGPHLHGHLLNDDVDVEHEVLGHGMIVLVPRLDGEGDSVNGDGAQADGVVPMCRHLEMHEKVLRVVACDEHKVCRSV